MFAESVATRFLVTSCGNPGTIRRGYFIGSDFSIGSTVEYKCARGYKLHGPAISVCKKHGTWTAQPECVGMQLSWCTDVIIIVSAGMSKLNLKTQQNGNSAWSQRKKKVS